MTGYLIVDSNLIFAGELHGALTKRAPNHASEWVVDPSGDRKLTEIAATIQKRVEEETVILINAEAVVGHSYLQAQAAIELEFWLRCKHRLKNVIVFYGLQSAAQMLKTRPEHFILLSPGCYYLTLPLNRERLSDISQLEPLKDWNSLKPYLKSRIDLTQTRHRFANYVGMVLMMFVARKVWGTTKEAVDETNALFRELKEFLDSLDYHLLRTYFELDPLAISEDMLSRLRVKLPSRRILLIDDLAQAWRPIIDQMLYSKDKRVIGKNIQQLKIVTERDRKTLDLENTQVELKKHIEQQKPHLILLDLRLSGEEGKRKLEQLGGYQLLRFLKGDPLSKGLPVIAFTASGNAEVTKALIEQGAEAVWTKPGLDESLSTDTVVERYESLIRHVQGVFNRFADNLRLDSPQDIEQTRLAILRRIEYLRYRAKLSKLHEKDHYFNKFTDIFIDTSAVIDSGEDICNIYQLAHICGKTNHLIRVGSTDFPISVPKVIFINLVLDEIIHWSKKVDPNPKKAYLWKTALLAYDVVRGLFQDSMVRTEFTFTKISDEPVIEFTRTARHSYADDGLVYEAEAIFSGQSFELWGEFPIPGTRDWTTETRRARYKTGNRRVLVITKESEMTVQGIPARIRAAAAAANCRRGQVEVMSHDDLAYQLKELRI
ncbi:MAG TPA: hypothetical protein VLL54_12880 [Pyrinomonadaceae bacterium]|nr:hypothetical protein [Pyrinomonadaceae bacterium]